MNFTDYYFGTIRKPLLTFQFLVADKRNVAFAFYSVTITAILYTLVYVFLIFGGGQPFKPWLDIPLESYYRYNVFFCAPSMYLGWILAAGTILLLSRVTTQAGSFDQTLALFGFAISVASWTTGIHDVVTSFLGAAGIISQHEYEIALNSPTPWRALLWVLMSAYLVWFVILFSKSVQAVYALKPARAFFLGLVGFIIYQSFFLIFNR